MKFDEYMHDSMKEIAQEVQPDSMLRARVMNRVQLQRTKTRPHRMRFAMAAAAVLCVLVGGAFAAGPIVALTSSTNVNDMSSSLADEAKVEKEAGFEVRLPETLDGATFDNMIAQPVDAVDADGNTIYSYQEFDAFYHDGDTQPFLTVVKSENHSSGDTSDQTIVETREVNGITLTYREIPTIFLPGSGEEQPTAEEQAAADRGELYISYGTDTREDGMYHTIDWDEDGLHYSIAANNGDWTADNYFAAAEDVMNTAK